MPLVLSHQPASAVVAQIMQALGYDPRYAEQLLAATIHQGAVPVYLDARRVPEDDLPRLRMDLGRSIGWVAPNETTFQLIQDDDGNIVGSVPISPTRCDGDISDERWRLPDDFEGGARLLIDADAVHRMLDRNAPPVAPATSTTLRKPTGPQPLPVWEDIWPEVCAWVLMNGVPPLNNVADLVRHLMEWGHREHGDRFVSESRLREKLREFLQAVQRAVERY